ncbi:hypothetical protein BJH93_03975 [Kocuria polaris]|nr:hypothetical protein [Kocuria polaris]
MSGVLELEAGELLEFGGSEVLEAVLRDEWCNAEFLGEFGKGPCPGKMLGQAGEWDESSRGFGADGSLNGGRLASSMASL